MFPRIDHLVIAVADPDDVAAQLEAELGLEATGGGRHEALGAFNRLVWLGDTYLELISVFNRAIAERSWLGPPVLRTLDGGVGLATWAIATDALEYELTPDAIDLGLDAVLPPILELESQIGEFGRGERASVSLTPHMVPREGPARLLFEGPHLIETDFRSSTSGLSCGWAAACVDR